MILATYAIHGRGRRQGLGRGAFNLFDKAQARGCMEAKGNLGLLYLCGVRSGGEVFKRAAEVFSDGAKDGDAFCMMQFARCLENGTGVTKDSLKAMYWSPAKPRRRGSDDAIKWCIKHSIAISRLSPEERCHSTWFEIQLGTRSPGTRSGFMIRHTMQRKNPSIKERQPVHQ